MRLVVFTDRFEDAVAFFREGLRLPAGPGANGSSTSALFTVGDAEVEVVAESRRLGAGVMLRLDVDDVASYGASLAACGRRPLGPIDLPWGERLSGVGGPGGLLINLVERVTDPQAPLGIAPTPPRTLAVVSCVDINIDPMAVLGLGPTDAHLVTNAGGVVTHDTVRDLALARLRLGVERVIVVQHERCEFLQPGPLPVLWPPDPIERLRASVSRLVLPPLSLKPQHAEGLYCEAGGHLTHVRAR